MSRLISYAQNGEDVRIWHAFGPKSSDKAAPALTYVDVGANDPRDLSITAALYDLGWRGILIEADPDLVHELRVHRPDDIVVQAAAASEAGTVPFYRVPGTGLGTLERAEADAAIERGFSVSETTVECRRLDDILDEHLRVADGQMRQIHAMTIDVEGAEAWVLEGLSLTRHRPWVLCIESVEPGTGLRSHNSWEPLLLARGYRFIAFDGVNRWYVAEEHADEYVTEGAGAPLGSTIAEAVATPFNAIDEGAFGWRSARAADLERMRDRGHERQAWQRQLLLHDLRRQVPPQEYERQINELRAQLIGATGSRAFRVSRKLAGVFKRALVLAKRVGQSLPRPVNDLVIRRRHLKHVTVNMGHLTESAYLDEPSPISASGTNQVAETTWVGAPRPPLPPGIDLHGFTRVDVEAVETWLNQNPWDDDNQLSARMDNHDDEVGRVQSALRSRLQIFNAPADRLEVRGSRLAIDVRALQSPAFGNRGIGRFARAVVQSARSTLADDRITLIVDPALHPLPPELAGGCQQVSAIWDRDVDDFSMLIQTSPMTHSPDPLLPLLHSSAHCLTLVYDFIPLHYSSTYLSNVAARAEYAARLDALKLYADFVCISEVVRKDLAGILRTSISAARPVRSEVAWSRGVKVEPKAERINSSAVSSTLVLATGDEPRKNTFGGLAGIAAATSDQGQRSVLVLGMAQQGVRVHHWSIAAAMRPGEAKTLNHLGDGELIETLRSAACVVVPSFDEGLSLPVIEAIAAGTPVVASDIPSHRELIGHGSFLFNPRKPRSISRAIRRTQGKARIWKKQYRKLTKHQHEDLEDVIASRITEHVPANPTRTSQALGKRGTVNPSRLSIGVATPWPPQRTGVADFSSAVFTALAEVVDVTIYTTTAAQVRGSLQSNVRMKQRHISEIYDHPRAIQQQHDAVISVIGNSHYHVPFVEVLRHIEAIAIAHDTRMVEYYMALRGKGGAEQLMLTTADSTAPRILTPPLDDQIDDMRLLQNAGMWEVANRATRLIMHTPSAAPIIQEQTGVSVDVLPFAHYRDPGTLSVSPYDRQAARNRLGLDRYPEGTVHLGSFGYVDPRTKMSGTIIESAAWLHQWGYAVALHLIGAASEDLTDQLSAQARSAGVPHFQITGFQDESRFRDWLLAVDLGVQLRISPLLGVSGPVSDLAAFGTPAVASSGLCADVAAPDFIRRLPDSVSPVNVAQEIVNYLQEPTPDDEREHQRRTYMARHTPELYAQLLLDLIAEDLR